MNKKAENKKAESKQAMNKQAETKQAETKQAETATDIATGETVTAEVVPSYMADIETAGEMFAEAKTENLETTKDLKGNDLPFIPYTFERDGETVTGKITDKATIGCIQRIRVASKVETASRLVISANLGYLINHGAFQQYGVTSVDKLSERLDLGLTPEMSRKCAKVGKVFLTVDEAGLPQYKDGIPHLPVSSLDYLATLVDEVKDDNGKVTGYNYDRLADFISENGITDSTSQGRIKALLPKKETKQTGKKATTANTSGEAVSIKTRAGYLTKAVEGFEKVVKYITDFAEIDEQTEQALTAVFAEVHKVLEAELARREEDMQNSATAEKWESEMPF